MGEIVAAMATVHAPQLFTRPPSEDPAQLDADIAAMRELGKTLDETVARGAADLFLKDAQPAADNGYKVPMARALIQRTLLQLRG